MTQDTQHIRDRDRGNRTRESESKKRAPQENTGREGVREREIERVRDCAGDRERADSNKRQSQTETDRERERQLAIEIMTDVQMIASISEMVVHPSLEGVLLDVLPRHRWLLLLRQLPGRERERDRDRYRERKRGGETDIEHRVEQKTDRC